ncbi:thioredoxin-disulfide reductase [Actinomycetaceae bacterium MB13-C1-2]|nr:thioredoxin-disulfide reductase [Actinomycetaceae bacterium MB13-C1-2]
MSQGVEKVVVIGSGPAGYTAAIYAGRAGFKPYVIAGAIDAGGALMTTTEVENFPGFPDGVMGPDLMEKMREQAERFEARVEFDDVLSVDLKANPKVVRLYEREIQAESVIIATGSAYRHLNIPGEEEFSGRGVSYCATCDGFFFKEKELVVVGGGDSAMEEALFLTRFASKVTVVHRRDQLRASKVMAERALTHQKIEFVWDSAVVEILGDASARAVVLENLKTGVRSEMKTDGVFVAVGHDPRSGLFADQLDLDEAGYVKVADPGTATSIKGVFACGDVVDHTYRQAITAAGSGCRAALDAQHYLEI